MAYNAMYSMGRELEGIERECTLAPTPQCTKNLFFLKLAKLGMV